jgi:hypothetical protein
MERSNLVAKDAFVSSLKCLEGELIPLLRVSIQISHDWQWTEAQNVVTHWSKAIINIFTSDIVSRLLHAVS